MNRLSRAHKLILGLLGVLLVAGAGIGLVLTGMFPVRPGNPERENAAATESASGEQEGAGISTPDHAETPAAEVVGSEVYDFSLYEESSRAYAEALEDLEEPWLPRKAVVKPKGPEGGEYPNAPAPVYTAYPGQVRETSAGGYEPVGTRTWIGDLAVGTEVTLRGAADQGEWCFVSGETLGGWSATGWIWCYRLHIIK
jgi:hypothetical protein